MTIADETYMKMAVSKAKESKEAGGLPLGAILVKDGSVIAQGSPAVWRKKDPAAHGEIECLRNACQKMQAVDLSGCTLYTTLECCSMCLACAAWSNVSEVVFGAYREDVPGNPYERVDYHAMENAQDLVLASGKPLVIRGGVLREKCRALMSGVKNWTMKP